MDVERFKQDILWLVDGTGEDWDALGEALSTRIATPTEFNDLTNAPYATKESHGFMDPLCWRVHDLKQKLPNGTDDIRYAITMVDDYNGRYEEVADGDAPFNQSEVFTAANRSTRHRDQEGRVAIGPSFRRIVDSSDGLYALALTMEELGLGESAAPAAPGDPDSENHEGLPPEVTIRENVINPDGTTSQLPNQVSIQGTGGTLTFRGDAAIEAARQSHALGGDLQDIAAAASAAARGFTPPPPRPKSQERPAPNPEPEPDANPAGLGVAPGDRPAGIIHNGDHAGLIGSFWTLDVLGSWYAGHEGTTVGPTAMRHDAHVAMGGGHVGRIMFVSDDASAVPAGSGKPFKGEMWFDPSRANLDTELGLEAGQWRPVIRVKANLPPADPPPKPPPPPWQPPPPKKKKEKEEEEKDKGPETGGGGRDPGETRERGGGRGSGVTDKVGPKGAGGKKRKLVPTPVSAGGGGGDSGAGGGGPKGGRVETGDDTSAEGAAAGAADAAAGVTDDATEGENPPISAAGSQGRDFSKPGVACPNVTAGSIASQTRDQPPGTQAPAGHPAVNVVDGTIVVGGIEVYDPAGGFFSGGGGGILGLGAGIFGLGGSKKIVDFGDGDGLFGLGKGGRLVFEPEPNKGKGVPRNSGENRDKAIRKAKKAKRQKARDDKFDAEQKAREARIKDLAAQAKIAEENGNKRKAKRLRRREKNLKAATEKRQARKDKRAGKRQAHADWKARRRERHDERVLDAQDAKARKRDKVKAIYRDKTPAQIREIDKRLAAAAAKRSVKGGFFIDTTFAESGDAVGDSSAGALSQDEIKGLLDQGGGYY